MGPFCQIENRLNLKTAQIECEMKQFGMLIILILRFCTCQQDNHLEYLKNYSKVYVFDRDNFLNRNLPDNFCHKVEKAYKTDSTQTLVYLNLILLKMYKGHLECCQQSYGIRPIYNDGIADWVDELNDENCIFYYVIQHSTAKNHGFVTSALAYMNAKNDTLLQNNALIKEELLKVESIRDTLGY